MPEYTIRIVYKMQYHVRLVNAAGINLSQLNNNSQFTRTFDNDAAFRAYIIEFCKGLRAAYDMAQNVNTAAVTNDLGDRIDLWELRWRYNLEGDGVIPYDYYTYPIVEYLLNGLEATITLKDEIDLYGQHLAGVVRNC